MNKREKEKRLDELISRTINTEKPQFDVEKWKQKYPDEFQALLSRTANGDSARRPNILKVIRKSPLTKLAAAAVIIVAIGFFIVHQRPSDQDDTTETVREAISKLSASARELIFLRYYDGMSYEQISSVLGISEQAINGRLRRAKKKMADYLRRNGFGEA